MARGHSVSEATEKLGCRCCNQGCITTYNDYFQRECLVYSNRFDEYFAVSNGLSVAGHINIHNQLANMYQI